MATIIRHRKIDIVTLDPGEAIADHCKPGDIALLQTEDGWWTHFVADNGDVEGYDAPFKTYNEALWTAKAAAEFDSQ